MIHKIIFVNGPPGSGKDTAGSILRSTFDVRLYKMSRPIKDGLTAFFNISQSTMRSVIEPHKDERNRVEAFRGMSWREIQISLAEQWAKRCLGEDIFGRLATTYLGDATSTDMTVITDSGFREECLPVVQQFGPAYCLLIQLMREGCTFEGDSRSYIELDDLGVTTIQLNNRYPLEPTEDMPITFRMQLGQAVRGWLEEEQEA